MLFFDRYQETKKSKGDQPRTDGKRFLVAPEMEWALLAKYGEAWRSHFIWEGTEEATWLPLKYYRHGDIPLTELAIREEQKQTQSTGPLYQQPEPSPFLEQAVKAPKVPLKINIHLLDLASEPDSFERQKEALFRYARYLKRVPTVEEGLHYIRDQRLFTGSWDENLARRTTRVSSVLKWIANTFDACKCATGSVNVGKFDEWAFKKFPRGLIGGKQKYLHESGEVIEVCQHIHVSTSFIACFMAVAEFTLLIDKNHDNTFPHDRAEQLWNALNAKGLITVRFCARKWAVCREELVRYGIVRITNRDYHRGKAMEWDVGTFFPGLGLWKGKKYRGTGCLPTEGRRTREEEHNTWLRQQPHEVGAFAGLLRSRPPP